MGQECSRATCLGIDCDSPKHHMFKIYAAAMILVYPIGIPLMYFVLRLKTKGLTIAGKPDW